MQALGTYSGLLNTGDIRANQFSNAVELIVAIIALVKDEIIIVQTSLIGSMLSNLLLVLGMCFFFGGLDRLEQHFNTVVAQTATSLLALAVGSLIIPTAFHSWSGGMSHSFEYLVTENGKLTKYSWNQRRCSLISRYVRIFRAFRWLVLTLSLQVLAFSC